jgi:hypothetical protein
VILNVEDRVKFTKYKHCRVHKFTIKYLPDSGENVMVKIRKNKVFYRIKMDNIRMKVKGECVSLEE